MLGASGAASRQTCPSHKARYLFFRSIMVYWSESGQVEVELLVFRLRSADMLAVFHILDHF